MRSILAALADILLLYISSFISFSIRFHSIPLDSWHAFLNVVPYYAATVVALGYLFDMYHRLGRKAPSEIVISTVVINLLALLIGAAMSYWTRSFAVPRSVLIFTFGINSLVQLLFRFALILVRRSRVRPRLLIVANTSVEAMRLRKDADQTGIRWTAMDVLTAPYNEYEHLVPEYNRVLIGATVSASIRPHLIHAGLGAGCSVSIVPDSQEVIESQAKIDFVGESLTVSYQPLEVVPIYAGLKRIMDVIISGVLLIVTSPFSLLLLILIPLSSPGSPFYSQTRVGLHGRLFSIYKFRSMVNNAEATTGAVLAKSKDPRITKLGHFIRTTRLDELPQLYNVLRGDMSLIGPRPERPEFVNQFEEFIPGYALRKRVRPGITGFAQVMANYTTDATDKLRYDLWYIQNCGLLTDAKILFQTLVVVLRPIRSRGVEVSSDNGALRSNA